MLYAVYFLYLYSVGIKPCAHNTLSPLFSGIINSPVPVLHKGSRENTVTFFVVFVFKNSKKRFTFERSWKPEIFGKEILDKRMQKYNKIVNNF